MISAKNSLSFTHTCILIAVAISENEYGQETETQTETEIYCAELPIMSNEFFSANQQGIKASICLVVNSDEYTEQQLVSYQDKLYSIYRVYKRPDGYTELYCESRIGNV